MADSVQAKRASTADITEEILQVSRDLFLTAQFNKRSWSLGNLELRTGSTTERVTKREEKRVNPSIPKQRFPESLTEAERIWRILGLLGASQSRGGVAG